MTYRISGTADRDLLDIYVYGAIQFGTAQAEEYERDLHACFGALADNPWMGRLRTEFFPPVRIHHHHRHLIIYDTKEDDIVILRVLHDTMDLHRHL